MNINIDLYRQRIRTQGSAFTLYLRVGKYFCEVNFGKDRPIPENLEFPKGTMGRRDGLTDDMGG